MTAKRGVNLIYKLSSKGLRKCLLSWVGWLVWLELFLLIFVHLSRSLEEHNGLPGKCDWFCYLNSWRLHHSKSFWFWLQVYFRGYSIHSIDASLGTHTSPRQNLNTDQLVKNITTNDLWLYRQKSKDLIHLKLRHWNGENIRYFLW